MKQLALLIALGVFGASVADARPKKAKAAQKKKKAPKKSTTKPRPKAARARSAKDEQREVHYSDLRKVMLASVLKRLK